MWFDTKNIEIKSVENGSTTINLNTKETDKLAKAFLTDFLVGKKIKYINNALKLRDKRFIENYLRKNIKNMYSFMEMVETAQIIKERTGINLEEALKEALIEEKVRLSLTKIIKAFENIKFTKEEREKIIKERLENYYFPLEVLDEVKDKYRDIASEVLNNNVSNILDKLRDYWYYFDKIGRGSRFETVRDRLIGLRKHRDLLTAENDKKISDFLLKREESVDAIIKRRIKKKNHQKYIKALLSFLPDEFKKKYLVYFL